MSTPVRRIKHGDGKSCPDSAERIARAKLDPPNPPQPFIVLKRDGSALYYGPS